LEPTLRAVVLSLSTVPPDFGHARPNRLKPFNPQRRLGGIAARLGHPYAPVDGVRAAFSRADSHGTTILFGMRCLPGPPFRTGTTK